jgi:predicted dehydrogenase
MDRAKGAGAVEEAMVAHLECASGLSCLFDVSGSYVGEEERWWFEVLATRGSARLAPLRVVKELNGRPTDVSPSGALGRESAFIQSYRAELAHFLSVVSGETAFEPPADQVIVHRIVEAMYRGAEEGKEVRL